MTALLAPDYIPDRADHTFLLRQRGATMVTTLSAGTVSVNIFDGDLCRSPSREKHVVDRFETWGSQLAGPRNPFCISFVFDLTTYDRENTEYETSHPARNAIQGAVEHFGIMTRTHPARPVLLFLVNVSEFARRLAETPLSRVCEDYAGGDEPGAASEYILERFRANNGAGTFHGQVCDLLDWSNLTFLYGAVRDCVVEEKLLESGILTSGVEYETASGGAAKSRQGA